MTEMEAGGTGDHILPFPLQNTLTRPLRTAAAKQARSEYLSLWAGQGLRLARRQSAYELIARLERETMETLERLSASAAHRAEPVGPGRSREPGEGPH
jgi:nitronate monooxygenase